MDRSPSPDFNSPKKPERNNGSLEKREAPPYLTIEYYKNKSNGIERNLDDVLEAVLFNLATKTKDDFDRESKACEKNRNDTTKNKTLEYDALSIKEILQLPYLPTLNGDTLEGYRDDVQAFKYFLTTESKFSDYIDGLSEEEKSSFFEESNRVNEIGLNYYRSVENGEVNGMEMVLSGGVQAFSTKNYEAGSQVPWYRVNIKVDPFSPETPAFIITNLVKELSKKEGVMKAGFRCKVMAEGSCRDGIIIYTPKDAFTGVADVVTKYFDDNPGYHDRHADKGIMFGTPLETADRRKFPGIRVTADPKEPFTTFNYLQAAIVSLATVDYVKKYYGNDHTKMLHDFGTDYYDAFLKWEQHFPSIYKNAVKEVLGNDQQVDNIAFLGE